MTGTGMTGTSENIAAAERYLGLAAAPDPAVEAVSAAQPHRRWTPLALARAWQRLRGWLAALRLRPGPCVRMLSVVERLDLGPKKSLWVVAYGGRHFLVASSAESIAAMLEIGPAGSSLSDRIPVITPVCWMAN